MSHLARRPKRRIRRYSGAGDVRGFSGFMQSPLFPILGIGALGFIFLGKGSTVMQNVIGQAFDYGRAAAFRLALPPAVAQYATAILTAAQRFGVDPWALAAIMYNESRGGIASGYTPQGPAGTGDFIPRWAGNKYFQFANPQTGLPPDGKGWGRGLMQIDYGVHNAWVTTNPWYDAQTNIDKGAEILKWNLDYFRKPPGSSVTVESWRITKGMPQYGIAPWQSKYPRSTWPTQVADVRPLVGQPLYEAAIAAYNVSYPAVLQALGLGLPAEAGTSNQSYVSKFLSLVSGWKVNFK